MAALGRPERWNAYEHAVALVAGPSHAARIRSTELLSPAELNAWHGVFDRLGIPDYVRGQTADRASANGTSIPAEFVASGFVDEGAFYQAIAAELGVPFAATVRAVDIATGDRECLKVLRRQRGAPAIRLHDGPTATQVAIATDRLPLQRMKRFLDEQPAMRERFRVVPRGAMRAALLAKCRPELMRSATDDLFAARPELSARVTATPWQGFALGLLVLAVPSLFMLFPAFAWLGLHLACSFFFLACVGLRVAALASAAPNRLAPLDRVSTHKLPTYSVLIALYKESEIVPELLVALGSILWPRSKLEIKFVCEADDRGTIEALRAQPLKPWVEIIEVPPGGPRTKPKALAYALPATSGEFVVLYDAEDRPHPAQLLEAWQTFQVSHPQVACLQAPLQISNGGRNLIARMFGLEYSALFHGLLPFLSKWRLLIPLGGTSNHFRRSALEDVGGWDPFNVTEDADIGMRLLRGGYRTQTITRPTFEPASDCWSIWVPQRTRWFKGWCQTWLVHMRSPGALLGQIGPSSFGIAQILFAGLVLSAIAHPLMIGTGLWLTWNLLQGMPLGVIHSVILVVDATNIACGYASFLLLGWRTLEARDRKAFWRLSLFTPVYWMMMSLAAWRALWQLVTNPHRWEKTPHFRTEPALDRPEPSAGWAISPGTAVLRR